MSGVQHVTVAEGEGDQRLDRWLQCPIRTARFTT